MVRVLWALVPALLALPACSPRSPRKLAVEHTTAVPDVRIVTIRTRDLARPLAIRLHRGEWEDPLTLATLAPQDEAELRIVYVDNIGGTAGLYFHRNGSTAKYEVAVPANAGGMEMT